MKKRKNWSDLSRGQRRLIQIAGAIQVALFGAAFVDLVRRPGEAVRGKKPLWFPALFVNFVGPIAYFTVGRRRLGGAGERP